MTATEMEDVLKNCDRRISNVEQILPTLATKDDLKAFATKEDLEAFATKEDLRTGLEELKRHTDIKFERLEDKISTLAEHLADISQRLPPRV